MDLQNQARIKEVAEKFGKDNLVVLLGASEPDSASITAETVILGDPTFAGPLAGVSLRLHVYHVLEPEVKAEIDPLVYEEQLAMMELVINVAKVSEEIAKIRGTNNN